MFVFPGSLRQRDLRYEMPDVYRSREFSMHARLRTIKADGVVVPVWVVVVRRK